MSEARKRLWHEIGVLQAITVDPNGNLAGFWVERQQVQAGTVSEAMDELVAEARLKTLRELKTCSCADVKACRMARLVAEAERE